MIIYRKPEKKQTQRTSYITESVPDEDQGDIFTAANVKRICEVEKVIAGHSDYQKVCQLSYPTDSTST